MIDHGTSTRDRIPEFHGMYRTTEIHIVPRVQSQLGSHFISSLVAPQKTFNNIKCFHSYNATLASV